MHLNASGQEKIVELIGQTINIFKKKQEKSPIVLKWVETQINSNHNEPNDKTTNQNATIITAVAAMVAASIKSSTMTATAAAVAAASSGTEPKPIRKSNRIKNATSVSQNDFLWIIKNTMEQLNSIRISRKL
jgi:hypothetical protein